jgi:F-type H+-transporting ATPase subunit gamma
MASLKDIRSRIDSTKNTQQITRAMKMTSAAKLRRAQQNIVNMRPYAQGLLAIIADIAVTRRVEHALLSIPEDPKKILMIVVSSDRGLAGAFNTNINKYAERFLNENRNKFEKIDFIFIGRKASDYFRRRGVVALETILNLAKEVSYSLAAKVAARAIDDFKSGQYDEVRIVYNEFKSAISQAVVCERLLPIDISTAATLDKASGDFAADMIYEPPPEQLIEDLIVKHFNVQIFRAMSESVAAEHGARMAAMENATKNAGEMINALTLTYNKVRQASITTELIEITSGAEALKG